MNQYVPPFVTETDEPNWDDCGICSTLMAVAAWTHGYVVKDANGEPKTREEMKRLRERIRNNLGPGYQEGGLNLAEVERAFQMEWEWLPKFRTSDTYREGWENFLADGWSSVLCGNPIDVSDVNSPLRRWTRNDDFGHSVYIDRYSPSKKKFFVMDPLGRGDYDGEWVSRKDVLEYAWFTASGHIMATLFKKGDVSGGPMLNHEAGLKRQSNKVMSLAAGQKIFRSPKGSVLKQLANANDVEYFGPCEIPGWCAVEVRHGNGWVIGFVRSDAGQIKDKVVG